MSSYPSNSSLLAKSQSGWALYKNESNPIEINPHRFVPSLHLWLQDAGGSFFWLTHQQATSLNKAATSTWANRTDTEKEF